MKSKAINFALDTTAIDTNDYLTDDIRQVRINYDIDAEAAVGIAEACNPDAIVLVNEEQITGIFYPGYLQSQLPRASLVRSLLHPSMSLRDMILAIDDSDIDFHSESINYSVTMRRCPRGHLTAHDPCNKHGIPTQRYP